MVDREGPAPGALLLREQELDLADPHRCAGHLASDDAQLERLDDDRLIEAQLGPAARPRRKGHGAERAAVDPDRDLPREREEVRRSRNETRGFDADDVRSLLAL